ncbi:aminodeoxychorismate synthase component I [Niastella yeongjuensis]|uniref:Aminodeoxychorismate synthase component I n=1 Tax=Niastella yeongjuensis TaxID=354355 RepID=A0A1V9EM53_9BACT|nr:anthranilate synthase component I family protein [Niastella yeongjuensis]OQP47151.1 aminodeoxychorismate synthase component I [Niastella yeongjuensis]SEN71934.1 para-aminobenzoate synthetase component 1 [Niastella yeongjuensis]
MLSWVNQFNICCFLDNQHYNLPHHSIECMAAAGAVQTLATAAGTAFEQLKQLYGQNPDWLFGHFSYDLKNETEGLVSNNTDRIGFPDLCFFIPEVVLQLSERELQIGTFGNRHESVFHEICAVEPIREPSQPLATLINSRISKADYITTIQQLQQHILRGDCYEINFCQEFFAELVSIDPLQVYNSLSYTSPNPFAAYYKTGQQYLLCASPERYLKKEGNRIYSQPIKGTSKRHLSDAAEDVRSKEHLYNSPKDRSENVMIVDLVRNDLSKICEEASVQVDELFGIYSFPQVHQMISTVSGQLRPDIHFIDAVKATFPMGSMTGAPKKRVMELIELYEQTRRGIFSGAVGYITPDGDFDFNVVIRSIMYNAANKYLSFQAGSAITFYSDPEKEYEECLLKAAAIKKVLGSK